MQNSHACRASNRPCASSVPLVPPPKNETQLSGRILMEYPMPHRCVPSFPPSPPSQSLKSHRRPRQAHAERPLCTVEVPPVPRCAPERDFGTPVLHGALGTMTRDEVVSGVAEQQQQCKDREVRIALADVVQHAVEALGREVSEDLLVGPGPELQPLSPPPLKRTCLAGWLVRFEL